MKSELNENFKAIVESTNPVAHTQTSSNEVTYVALGEMNHVQIIQMHLIYWGSELAWPYIFTI